MSVLSVSSWNLEMLVVVEREKAEYLEKNLSEQRREPSANSAHIWRRRWDMNPSHTGGRPVFSALRLPRSPHPQYTFDLKRWYYTKKMRFFSEIVRKFFLLVFTSSMIYFSSSIIFFQYLIGIEKKKCNFPNTVAWLSW